jgi:hypothetical protein
MRIKLFLIFMLVQQLAVAQNDGAGSVTASAAMSSKSMDGSINTFSGIPNISVPIYQYKSSTGIGTSVSLEYAGGGVQVSESPTYVGLGWNLHAGGSIVRTVRGAPDDYPGIGYLNTGAIPTDFRTNADSYFNKDVDVEQDIFQFSVPGASGRFYIGKNKQIVIVPFSKVKIIPFYHTNGSILAFRIVNEDGAKFDFGMPETSLITYSQYTTGGNINRSHTVKWNLTEITSAFNVDTIRFNYLSRDYTYGVQTPQIAFVNDVTGQKKIHYFMVPGNGIASSRKISSIELPDKTTVQFIYSGNKKYTSDDYVLAKIKVMDTALRFGFALEYQDTSLSYYKRKGGVLTWYNDTVKIMLKSITPYTKYEKQKGFQFDYLRPYFSAIINGVNSPYSFTTTYNSPDFLNSSLDYWGFYNATLNNDSLRIPKVNGYTWGANRAPTLDASANMLSKVIYPTGGWVHYFYEPNGHLPFTKSDQQFSFAAQNNPQQSFTINQVYNEKHILAFTLDRNIVRDGNAPVTGNGTLNLAIKDVTGATTYKTLAISLYDLYTQGLKTWTFDLPNGTYKMYASLTAGTSITSTYTINVNWENRILDNTVNESPSGGLRVAYVAKYNLSTEDPDGLLAEGAVERYKYIREDGKSSGFLGETPKYHYPYTEVAKIGSNAPSSTNFTAVTSDPVAPMSYAQGAPVGYSRVEIIKQTIYNTNLGKEVYEFTDLKDMRTNSFTNFFPYSPIDYRTWGIGMPKRISVYDSMGTLLKRTVNSFQYDTAVLQNDNFKSLKLGHYQTYFLGDPIYSTTPRYKKYIGESYYVENGRIYATGTADTIYQTNGSMNTSFQQMEYDTNYNVSKVISSWDRSRGLQKEERRYYPYNYTLGGAIGKLRDSGLINNLISTETWITGDGNPRLLAAGITSYKQLPNGGLKPDSVFVLETNKPIPQSTIGSFNASVLNRNYNLIKPQSQFTLYDAKGELIETKSLVTGLSNTVLNGYENNYTIAKVANAANVDVAYTSFETTSNGNWTVNSTTRDNNNAITGRKSYNLSNGSITKSGLSTGTTYQVTLWAKTTASVQINGSTQSTVLATQGGWNLYMATISGASTVTVTGTGLIDELRLHPKDANMETTTYEPHIGVTSMADANNTIVYNEYDNLNRLKLVRNKDKNILKRYDYSDTVMAITTQSQWMPTGYECSNQIPGNIDSTFFDVNPFSDSTGVTKKKVNAGVRCDCPNNLNALDLRIVNGQCERGYLANTASVWKKVLVDGYLQWRWVCTQRYCFSDGSQSVDVGTIIDIVPCSINCSMPN